jgi:hypothetical protein
MGVAAGASFDLFDQFEGLGSGHSKNPLDNLGTGVAPSRHEMLSDDTVMTGVNLVGTTAGAVAIGASKLGGVELVWVFGGAFSGGPATVAAATGLGGVAAAAGAGYMLGTILHDNIPGLNQIGDYIYEKLNPEDAPPPPPPDTKPPQPGGNAGTPTPDYNPGKSRVIMTKAQARGIQARLNGKITPTGEGNRYGGPINRGATPQGRIERRAQWPPDSPGGSRTYITQLALNGIAARLAARITIINGV